MAAFVVPMFISFLPEANQHADNPPIIRRLRDLALKKVVDFGPRYPAEFRTVMQSRLDLRSRLERAVLAQQQAAAAAMSFRQAAESESRTAAQPSKASIKLKMDFSNFTS